MSEDRTQFQISNRLAGRPPSQPSGNKPLRQKGLGFRTPCGRRIAKRQEQQEFALWGGRVWFRFGNSRGVDKRVGAISVLAFLTCAFPGKTRAQSSPQAKQTARATLHISVVVVPLVQTPMVAAPATQEAGAIIYNFKSPAMSENYEIRMLPPGAQKGKKQSPVILKTLVVVPR